MFVMVTFWLLVCPTGMLLKFSEAGDNAMMASVPVPLSEMARGEFEASLVTVKVPLAVLSDVGANCTWTLADWPTGTDVAPLPLIMVNVAPVIVTCEMFTVAVPVLVTLTV